ncbi:ABC transporter ATP-binding protein [Haloarchaeobius sp. DFWS5]|uniref:ABC transporter ATP-binding protein n=1 Tax=Haloarchaeobius sp. DFWS5 TaxID=3446114 RepID=UPI003EBEB62C
MARTVASSAQSRRKRIQYGLFFLGVFMLVASIALFLPALQYEFQQDSDGVADGQRVNEYETLTPQEQRIVDGALDGKKYVLETSEPLPGTAQFALEPKHMKVNKQGTVHTFAYQNTFPATEPVGLAVIGLAIGGLLAMGEAARRYLLY